MTSIANEMRRPEADEFAPYYAGYVAAVPEGDIVSLLRSHGAELDAALRPLSEDRAGYRYAPGKWSVREVVGHLADSERIFAYRALRVARGDATPLPGFDENAYAAASGADARTLADLLDELRCVREGTVRLFASLSAEAWGRLGIANDRAISVRALAYITAGHAMHHMRVLRERYDLDASA